MNWEGKADAEGRVEDRRGMAPKAAIGGGIGSLIVLALVYFGGMNKDQAQRLVGQFDKGRVTTKGSETGGLDDKTQKFVGTVIALTDEVWIAQFKKNNYGTYEKPGMVLFSTQVDTDGCGRAPSAVGPFYCPADKKVYLDPTFFKTLEQELDGSAAEFSQAYVIGHEVGHHVQNLLGYNALLKKYETREGDNAGMRLELQADYLAGCWAYHANKAKQILDAGDLDEALKTAKSIGDDAIQKKTQGWTSPEKYNHGTAAQRLKYFKMGFQSGDASKEALDRFFNPNVRPLDL